jgi:hypothetical protein
MRFPGQRSTGDVARSEVEVTLAGALYDDRRETHAGNGEAANRRALSQTVGAYFPSERRGIGSLCWKCTGELAPRGSLVHLVPIKTAAQQPKAHIPTSTNVHSTVLRAGKGFIGAGVNES